jgi:hypothetical protein
MLVRDFMLQEMVGGHCSRERRRIQRKNALRPLIRLLHHIPTVRCTTPSALSSFGRWILRVSRPQVLRNQI